MEQNDNMAPGQQNYPKADKKENFNNAISGEEIIAGAKQEDQLDQFKENAGRTKPDEPAGED